MGARKPGPMRFSTDDMKLELEISDEEDTLPCCGVKNKLGGEDADADGNDDEDDKDDDGQDATDAIHDDEEEVEDDDDGQDATDSIHDDEDEVEEKDTGNDDDNIFLVFKEENESG